MITSSFETELFRLPLIIEGSTYGAAVLLALGSAAVSAAVVRKLLDNIDMIAVLKTRE